MIELDYDELTSTAYQLRCTACGDIHNIDSKHRLCSCGKVLFAEYDLEKAKETLVKSSFHKRRYDIWRMAEIMPVFDNKYRFTLGEGWTPIVKINNLGEMMGLKNLYLKDESFNPTGSFKSRGLCAAVSRAVELGINDFVIPTAGNAGAALAAYAARTKSKAHVFMPEDTPPFIVREIKALGADARLVDGIITDAGKIAKEEAEKEDWFDISTLKEPYRVEGKKTMGLELAEQFNWSLPDVIVYPTGGGTGIIGMWKAFDELEQLGFIDSQRPRMISVQSSTCAPIVKAFKEGKDHAEFWEDAHTIAAGLRVPSAIADYLILKTIRDSKGTAIAVDDLTIKIAMNQLAKEEGIMLSPEAAATVASLDLLIDDGDITKEEKVVIFGTGSGLTTPEEW
ncbi:MAG: threonine synthase [Candidatus Heimdallarchaeota archaeon]|nr:threonine synthase [Candidatus Heimdallarchaeota archaeon]MCK5144125.1 threonine synthase [Candidatus Heimdallarchaeota archaeon]